MDDAEQASSVVDPAPVSKSVKWHKREVDVLEWFRDAFWALDDWFARLFKLKRGNVAIPESPWSASAMSKSIESVYDPTLEASKANLESPKGETGQEHLYHGLLSSPSVLSGMWVPTIYVTGGGVFAYSTPEQIRAAQPSPSHVWIPPYGWIASGEQQNYARIGPSGYHGPTWRRKPTLKLDSTDSTPILQEPS